MAGSTLSVRGTFGGLQDCDAPQHLPPHSRSVEITFTVETVDVHRRDQKGALSVLRHDRKGAAPELLVARHSANQAVRVRTDA